MLLQDSIAIFRVIQMIQDKAQSEENGRVLFKDCNAVLDHLDYSLWARHQAFVRVVESFGKRAGALGKDRPLPASLA